MKKPLTDPRQLARRARRVRALESSRPAEMVEVTFQLPRDVWQSLEAQGPKAVERLAAAVVKAAKLKRRKKR